MGPEGFSSRLTAASLRRHAAKGKRRAREVTTGQELKRERVASGRGCESCGWLLGSGDWRSLHAHHVVPLSCGGTDQRGNLMVLCPNHHAVAHRAGRMKRGVGWTGPRTREELFRVFARVDSVVDA